ncbi:MAG: hypothetical protein LBJ43_04940, partial [Propionibacteriaceae bacterium]|nr:hypothetical protein [Propionibacteriaceae bacterium]
VGVDEVKVFDVGLVTPVDSVVVTPEAFNEFISVSTDGLVTFTSKGLLPDTYMFTLIWTDELGQSTVSEFAIEVVADSDAPLGNVSSGGKLIRPIPSTALLGFLLLGISCILGTGYQHTHKTNNHPHTRRCAQRRSWVRIASQYFYWIPFPLSDIETANKTSGAIVLNTAKQIANRGCDKLRGLFIRGQPWVLP